MELPELVHISLSVHILPSAYQSGIWNMEAALSQNTIHCQYLASTATQHWQIVLMEMFLFSVS